MILCKMILLSLITALLLGIGAGAPSTAVAQRAVLEESVALWSIDPDAGGPIEVDDEVLDSIATLVRSRGGLTFTIWTKGLKPRHVITVWVKVFSASVPGGVFLKPVPGARGISGADGSIHLSGTANANKHNSAPAWPADFEPLLDAVELHIQDHGRAREADHLGTELTNPIAGHLIQRAAFP